MACHQASTLFKSPFSRMIPREGVSGLRNVFRRKPTGSSCLFVSSFFSNTRLPYFSGRLLTPTPPEARTSASFTSSCLSACRCRAPPKTREHSSSPSVVRKHRGMSSADNSHDTSLFSPYRLRCQRRQQPRGTQSSSSPPSTLASITCSSSVDSGSVCTERRDDLIKHSDKAGRKSFSPFIESSLSRAHRLFFSSVYSRELPSTSPSISSPSLLRPSFSFSRDLSSSLPLSFSCSISIASSSSSPLFLFFSSHPFSSCSSSLFSRPESLFPFRLPLSSSCQKSFLSTSSEKEKDFYEILGVSENATQDDIKRAYRRLALKWHPDRNPDNRQMAEEKFRSVSGAYQTLSNPERRQEYDTIRKFGGAGRAQGTSSSFASSSDFFRGGGPHPFTPPFGSGGGAFRYHRMSQQDAERLFAQVFGGVSLQDLFAQLLREEGQGGGARSGPFARGPADFRGTPHPFASSGSQGRGAGEEDFFKSSSSMFGGRDGGATSSSRVVNIIHRDGRTIERTILTNHYPGGRIQRQVIEREVPHSSDSHPFHGFSSPFDSPFFRPPSPPPSSSSSSSPFSNRGIDIERLLRETLFPLSSYPQPSSSSSSSEKQRSSSPDPTSSSSSSQQPSGEKGRGEGGEEKISSSPRGLLSELFSKNKKNLSASTSASSPSSVIKTALWEEAKQAMKGVKEVFFLNIKLWLMNKMMSLLNKLIQRLLRRR